MESRIPPGFRFHPSDEELVGYYLKKKVACEKLDLNVIKDIDLYRIEPWDIQERCKIGNEEQKEWYFFSHKDKKYPTGTRTNRATMAGFWKATGRDKPVYRNTNLIGMRKTLVFYKGRAPNGHKSDWIMHEYRLECHQNAPPQEEGWVVCRAFTKRANVKYKQACDDKFNLYDPETIDPRNTPNLLPSSSHNFLCKQEFDHNTATMINNHNLMMMNNLNNINMHQPFLQQLPHLESPSPLLSDQINNITNNNDLLSELVILDEFDKGFSSPNPLDNEKVTDWRALDKFVASQLSHDNEAQGGYHSHNDQGALLSFGGHDHNEHGLLDMALILLQNSVKDGEEDKKLINGLLATTSESELGILHM